MSGTRKVRDRSTTSSASSAIASVDPIGTVYVVMHEHLTEDGDDAKLIGLYRNLPDAERAIARARLLPGFAEQPDNFTIDAHEIGRDNWTSGFVSVQMSLNANSTGRAA